MRPHIKNKCRNYRQDQKQCRKLIRRIMNQKNKKIINQQYRDKRKNAYKKLRPLHTVYDILYERKNIIARPVKDKSWRTIIQQHKEYGSHRIELNLVPQGEAFCINCAGDTVYKRHENRQQIYWNRPDMQKRVAPPQVGNKIKAFLIQERKFRKECICGHEKRYLNQQRKRRFQSHQRMIIILFVKSLNHHKTLITMESILYSLYAQRKLLLNQPLLPLPFFGSRIERQGQKADRNALAY